MEGSSLRDTVVPADATSHTKQNAVSYVLTAMDIPAEYAQDALHFS